MGGSSKQVIGYQYFSFFLLFIGNPIEKVLGINFDKRGWHAPLIDEMGNPLSVGVIEKATLYGENEGGVAGQIHARYGTDNQEVISFYKDYMDSKELPASVFPYQSYLAFPDFYVGNSGYMKEMLLWPKRIHIRNDGRAQWYDEKSEVQGTVSIGTGSQYVDINEGISPIFNYYVKNLNTGFTRSYGTNAFPFSDGMTSNVSQGIVDDYEQNISFRITGSDFNRFNLYRVSILLTYHVNYFSAFIPIGLNTLDSSIRDVTSNYVDPNESNWRGNPP